MEFTHTVPVPAAADTLDLAGWIFGMTDEEYRACAEGHYAMGIVGAEKRLGVVNVEQIAGTLIIQHYSTVVAERNHVRFESGASEAFLMRTVPFTMRVWWNMTLMSARAASSELRCSIGFDAPNWVSAAGALVGNSHFLRKHLVEETGGFARDIARKHGQQHQ